MVGAFNLQQDLNISEEEAPATKRYNKLGADGTSGDITNEINQRSLELFAQLVQANPDALNIRPGFQAIDIPEIIVDDEMRKKLQNIPSTT